MAFDRGRQADLEEIENVRENAKTVSEREHYSELIHSITSESEDVRDLRDDLIENVRHNDTAGIKKIEHNIQYTRQKETNGTSWGDGNLTRKG